MQSVGQFGDAAGAFRYDFTTDDKDRPEGCLPLITKRSFRKADCEVEELLICPRHFKVTPFRYVWLETLVTSRLSDLLSGVGNQLCLICWKYSVGHLHYLLAVID